MIRGRPCCINGFKRPAPLRGGGTHALFWVGPSKVRATDGCIHGAITHLVSPTLSNPEPYRLPLMPDRRKRGPWPPSPAAVIPSAMTAGPLAFLTRASRLPMLGTQPGEV